MNPQTVIPKAVTILAVAAVAVIGSIGGRAAWDAVTAEEKAQPKPPPLEVLNDEAAKPKFEGELLGVFVGPYGAKIPSEFITYDDICGDEPTVEVDESRAGGLALPLSLPEPFKLNKESLNTGVIACGDTVYAARWEYRAVQPSGYPGAMIIARSVLKYVEREVSTGRVQIEEIAGLPAIVVYPLDEDGIGSQAGVIFPGESVLTEIQSEGVPRSELLKVAEIVAGSIEEQDK
jgi:hypothetical protein